jgi:tRNA pseudouridine32 synthase / 23S rRNA pseudouridine746 synthase
MHAFVVHADAHWLIVDKPAGLPSVPGRPVELHDCAASRVQALYADALVVHRLDMATSGLLVFARGADHQRTLHRAFAQRLVDKRYVAVVHGEVADAQGSIDLPLIVDWPNRPRQIVDATRGKPSLTHWRVLARADGRTVLELRPVTGRSHQLRVHCAAIGHPIVGDDLYAPPAVATAAARLLLHARSLTLPHPATGVEAHFTSEPPFLPLP